MKKIQVLVKPNAKSNSWGKDESGQIWMRIAAPPTEGKANSQAEAYLAEILGLSKSKVRLIKGQTSRLKTFEIEE